MPGPPPDPRHKIAPGIFGWLESPRPDDILQDCVSIVGWTFSRDVPIASIIVRGLGPDVTLEYPLRRDDVAAVYGDEAQAISSGFSGYVEHTISGAHRPTVEIWARLRDDHEVRLFTWSPARARLRRWLRSSVLTPVRQYRARATATGDRDTATQWFDRTCRLELQAFFSSDARILCPAVDTPRVSVVIALWNRAELTLRAVRAICEEREIPFELVLVDNGSTDDTPDLVKRITGATVISNETNLGFTVAANQGAWAARGELLLFLNSDAVVHPGALVSLIRTIDASPSIGAVGAKLIWPDGRLQEAGAVVWADGSCEAYGRGGDPLAPEHDFERDVDFCSGAVLLTRRDVFRRLSGFDERYKPAYYEDVDYCVRLWKEGLRVVYQPRAAATHVEFASSARSIDAVRLQRERQSIFVDLHRDWLSHQPSRSEGLLAARSRPRTRPWALVIDDVLPDPALGAGFPRAAAMLRTLKTLGWAVAVYPTNPERNTRASHAHFPDVEVLRSSGPPGLGALFEDLPPHIRLVIVSRSHNMRYVKAAIGRDLTGVSCPIIYDAEAIAALRDAARRRVNGALIGPTDLASLVQQEVGLAHGCAAVVAVSPLEQRHFADAGVRNVSVVGHAVGVAPTAARFDERTSLLFVGAFAPESPNEDAVRFLLSEVGPALRGSIAAEAPIVVAGAGLPDSLRKMARPGLIFQADVADLTPLYEAARVFVAPTRYSAGIPLKLLEAAARGVPIVCTTDLAKQLGWAPGTEVLAGDRPEELAHAIASVYSDAALWSRLRESALARVAAEYSPAIFESQLRTALGSAAITRGRPAGNLPADFS